MADDESFQRLLVAVRQGDDGAAEKLIRLYESELRIMARVRLSDPSMRRAMDSMDICQSIMGNFFLRAAAGEFEIESPTQLKKLLFTMLKNKVTDHARRQKADRRDARRIASKPADELPLAGAHETPSQIVAGKELLEHFNARLSKEERAMAQQRKAGMSWDEIAQLSGESAEALRKRHARAIQRVAREMGLEDAEDE